MMITKKLFKVTLGMTAVASLLSLMGCAAGPKGIAIVELDTMDKRKIRTHEGWKRIFSVKDDRFYTLQQTDGKLILRSRDYQGAILKVKELPLFDKLLYIKNKDISDNGNKLVSFDRRSRSIKMWELSDDSELTLVPAEVGRSGVRIRKVKFISDDEILIVLGKDSAFNRDQDQILKYHIPSETLQVVKAMSVHEVSLSPSKRFLAFTDRVGHNNLAVLDLEINDIIETQINKPGTTVMTFSWSPDETKIAYENSTNDTIYVYDITTQENSVVREFDEELLCYDLFFTDNEHLLYRLGPDDSSPRDEPLRIANIDSGEIVQTIDNIRVWGSLSVVDGGNRIIFIYQ